MAGENTRIKEVRNACGLSQDEFANKLGLKSRGKIANLESGKTEADKEFKNLICSTFNVDPEWMETGKGNMFSELTRDEQIAEFIAHVLKDKEESFKKRYISMLSKLDEDGWEALEQVAEMMCKMKKD